MHRFLNFFFLNDINDVDPINSFCCFFFVFSPFKKMLTLYKVGVPLILFFQAEIVLTLVKIVSMHGEIN